MKKEDVDKMTLQEACDYAVSKIVVQGGRCRDNASGCCSYGDGSGKHCAIGWLLDNDNEMLMEFEGSLEELIASELNDDLPTLLDRHFVVFLQLQSFHDRNIRIDRENVLQNLSDVIDTTTNPNYQKWVEMGE